jgi:CHASE2 domain-containing sensor protein
MESSPPAPTPKWHRSFCRGIMLLAMAVAALTWAGLIPPMSKAVWRFDADLRDRLSLMLSPTPEREDLVFIGIDEECRQQSSISPAVRRQSRALTLMHRNGGNESLDRRVFAALIERLAQSGVRTIIFDILFLGPSGDPATDREFARVLKKHGSRIVLSELLNPQDDGSYQPVSSLAQLPELEHMPGTYPQLGYVNLWPDAQDGIVRHMLYQTTVGALRGGPPQDRQPVHQSLAAVAGHSFGAAIPRHANPRLRFAVSDATDASTDQEPSFAEAYAPRSLLGIFDPEHWRDDYQSGAFFRDKVVLVSTAAIADEDRHPIPGATIYGAQFHLQALACLLQDSFWIEPPRWVELASLLVMAAIGFILVLTLRHPLAIVLAMTSIAGGAFVACLALSEFAGFLFAGTPGLLGLLAVTITGTAARIITEPHS